MAENEQQVQAQPSPAEETQEERGLLDQILEEGRLVRDESQKAWARDLVGEFVKQVMEGAMVVSKDTEAMINARIAQVAQQYNRRPERMRQELQQDGSLQQIGVAIGEEKALDALLADAEVTEAPAEKEQEPAKDEPKKTE